MSHLKKIILTISPLHCLTITFKIFLVWFNNSRTFLHNNPLINSIVKKIVSRLELVFSNLISNFCNKMTLSLDISNYEISKVYTMRFNRLRIRKSKFETCSLLLILPTAKIDLLKYYYTIFLFCSSVQIVSYNIESQIC